MTDVIYFDFSSFVVVARQVSLLFSATFLIVYRAVDFKYTFYLIYRYYRIVLNSKPYRMLDFCEFDWNNQRICDEHLLFDIVH